MTPPPLHDALADLARRLLRRLRASDGTWLVLRVRDDGRLLLRAPAAAWRAAEVEGGFARLLGELGGGEPVESERAGEPVVESLLDLGDRTAEFQTPAVLHALRAEARSVPEVAFRIELPAGVRDIQRARAGLDSGKGVRDLFREKGP